MDTTIRNQIIFVLEDDNDVMRSALQSDLDATNKRMNRELIARHEDIIHRVKRNERLGRPDLQLIDDANRIHLNDKQNLAGRHAEAVKLDKWLKSQKGMTAKEAMALLEAHLSSDPKTPAVVFEALHVLWEEATSPEDGEMAGAFDDAGRCTKCGSRVSFADVADTLVFVNDEIVKRYDGDITHRNCVRCTYPELYPEYAEHDAGRESDGK